MTNVQKVTCGVAAATFAAALGVAGVASTPPAAHADPTGHQVTYTITSTGNLTGSVRYITSDPANQAAFNANSSQFLSTVPTPFTPDQPLSYTATLTNPSQWAYVNASGGCKWPDCSSGAPAELHCEILVDGQLVTQNTAATSVTCSTRPW